MIAALIGTLCIALMLILWLILLVATQGRQRPVNRDLRIRRR